MRRAVGGFLRYVQHRDLHPTSPPPRPRPEVSGLIKYVAYRDQASKRAELFGPAGTLTSADREAFAGYVARALDESPSQLFRGRDGQLRDRRRAVYRFVISPERAGGLDLRQLTASAVNRLERESGISGMRWIAAIHRNTAHHHVHLVLAGMHLDARGYRRLDLTKTRLAAMKEELALEIVRQRGERAPQGAAPPRASEATPLAERFTPAISVQRWQQLQVRLAGRTRREHRPSSIGKSLMTLRAVARRYQRRMERELEHAYRQSHWEHAA